MTENTEFENELGDMNPGDLNAAEPAEDPLPRVEPVQVRGIIEAVLFFAEKPVGLSTLKEVFKGTGVGVDEIRRALDSLFVQAMGAERGIALEEVAGGFQLRTKQEHQVFVRRMNKVRAFRLSGPALEVLSIIAYKQPIVKSEVDQIRGVESGHLVRALMDRGLVRFAGKSELPGKPMLYATTNKFLEIFGLRNLRELPTLEEIDALLPEGVEEDDSDSTTLSDLTDQLSLPPSLDTEKEGVLETIAHELSEISTTSEFFEKEKLEQKLKRDEERKAELMEAKAAGEVLNEADERWLLRHMDAEAPIPPVDTAAEMQMVKAVAQFESDT